ncbi:MAG: Fur family transcriptional regulator [Acidimicrobiales bacterium]
MTEDLHTQAAAGLRQAGQRYTLGRKGLVELLAGSGRPLTIAEILDACPDVAQSSAYRNLADLEQAGIIRRVAGNDEFARYELAEDLSAHHHHLICTSCGTVADFTAAAHLEEAMAQTMAEVASSTGFAPDGHRVDLVGRCSDCA